MANYGTTENWLRSYGGEVEFENTDTELDKSGEIKIKFSRPVVFPRELLVDFDTGYREYPPELKLTEAEESLV